MQVFRARTPPEAMELVARLLEYTPPLRITPLAACAHPFFNELREQGTLLPNSRELPPLFNFTEHELRISPNLYSILIPKYMQTAETNTEIGQSTAETTTGTNTAGASGNSTDSNVNTTSPSVTQQNADPNQSTMA